MPPIRAALLLLLLPFFGNAGAQSIDTRASSIAFKIGNIGISSVKGGFSGMKGTVVFDPMSPGAARFDVCIDAATVDTGNKKRDKDLRSDGFFDVGKFPAICYSSDAVEKTGQGYMAKGKLTMHGVTKAVEIPFTYTNKTLTGKINLNRKDYGVGPDGTFIVGDEVEISIICVLK